MCRRLIKSSFSSLDTVHVVEISFSFAFTIYVIFHHIVDSWHLIIPTLVSFHFVYFCTMWRWSQFHHFFSIFFFFHKFSTLTKFPRISEYIRLNQLSNWSVWMGEWSKRHTKKKENPFDLNSDENWIFHAKKKSIRILSNRNGKKQTWYLLISLPRYW